MSVAAGTQFPLQDTGQTGPSPRPEIGLKTMTVHWPDGGRGRGRAGQCHRLRVSYRPWNSAALRTLIAPVRRIMRISTRLLAGTLFLASVALVRSPVARIGSSRGRTQKSPTATGKLERPDRGHERVDDRRGPSTDPRRNPGRARHAHRLDRRQSRLGRPADGVGPAGAEMRLVASNEEFRALYDYEQLPQSSRLGRVRAGGRARTGHRSSLRRRPSPTRRLLRVFDASDIAVELFIRVQGCMPGSQARRACRDRTRRLLLQRGDRARQRRLFALPRELPRRTERVTRRAVASTPISPASRARVRRSTQVRIRRYEQEFPAAQTGINSASSSVWTSHWVPSNSLLPSTTCRRANSPPHA